MKVLAHLNGLISRSKARQAAVTSSGLSPSTRIERSRRSSLRASKVESGPMLRSSLAKPHYLPMFGIGRGRSIFVEFLTGSFT